MNSPADVSIVAPVVFVRMVSLPAFPKSGVRADVVGVFAKRYLPAGFTTEFGQSMSGVVRLTAYTRSS